MEGQVRVSVIVEKADQVRFPKEAFEVNVSVSTTGEGGAPDFRKYQRKYNHHGDGACV